MAYCEFCKQGSRIKTTCTGNLYFKPVKGQISSRLLFVLQ